MGGRVTNQSWRLIVEREIRLEHYFSQSDERETNGQGESV
jgi:hypothetical protein